MLFRAVVDKADFGVVYAEARRSVRGGEHGELAEHCGLALGIGAAVAQQSVAAADVGYCGAERGTLYAAYSAENELSRRNGCAGRTCGYKTCDFRIVFEQAERPYKRRFVLSYGLGGDIVHIYHVAAVHYFKAGGVVVVLCQLGLDNLLSACENDVEFLIVFKSLNRALYGSGGRVISAHCVN